MTAVAVLYYCIIVVLL